ARFRGIRAPRYPHAVPSESATRNTTPLTRLRESRTRRSERLKDECFSSCTRTGATPTGSFRRGQPFRRREPLMKMRLSPHKPQRGRTDWPRVDAPSETHIAAAARSDRDAMPLSRTELASMKRLPDVKAIRTKLSMTQEQFAEAFHLSIATVRDWEQGRFQPD